MPTHRAQWHGSILIRLLAHLLRIAFPSRRRSVARQFWSAPSQERTVGRHACIRRAANALAMQLQHKRCSQTPTQPIVVAYAMTLMQQSTRHSSSSRKQVLPRAVKASVCQSPEYLRLADDRVCCCPWQAKQHMASHGMLLVLSHLFHRAMEDVSESNKALVSS